MARNTVPRADSTAYMREWRRRKDTAAHREAERVKANTRALWRLAAMHPEDYKRLQAEEQATARNDGDVSGHIDGSDHAD